MLLSTVKLKCKMNKNSWWSGLVLSNIFSTVNVQQKNAKEVILSCGDL